MRGDGRSAIDHCGCCSIPCTVALLLPWTGPGDLWSYTAANTAVACSGMAGGLSADHERIQAGFLNWTQGATGILYYPPTDGPPGTPSALEQLDTRLAAAAWEGRATDLPVPAGSIARRSPLRDPHEAIRDGMQDYELRPNFKNLGQGTFTTPSSSRLPRAGPTGIKTRAPWKLHACN